VSKALARPFFGLQRFAGNLVSELLVMDFFVALHSKHPFMIKQILLVGLGGGVGSILRYLVSWFTIKAGCVAMPVATLAVNLFGCFLIGLFAGWAVRQNPFDDTMRLLLMTGFCGGFTTFSAFSLENMQLFHSGHYLMLALYVAASLVFGFVAVGIGLFLAK
jgi:CrcB protein